MSRKEGGLGKMSIPLLADKNTKISRAYGVYRDEDGVTLRGLYIIDDKGTCTFNPFSTDSQLPPPQAFCARSP